MTGLTLYSSPDWFTRAPLLARLSEVRQSSLDGGEVLPEVGHGGVAIAGRRSDAVLGPIAHITGGKNTGDTCL